MNVGKQDRLSNFELLRIVSIFFITIHHFCIHGGFVIPSSSYFNTITLQVGCSLGKLGVNLFILITGYFMVESNFKIRSFLKLYFEVFFYSISILMLFKMFNLETITNLHINTYLYTIGGGAYWFFTTYMVLYLLVPFLNVVLKNIDKYQHFFLIALLTTIWSVLPMLISNVNYSDSMLGWFILVYIIAAYIRLYPHKTFDNQKLNILTVGISSLVILLSIFVANYNNNYQILPSFANINSFFLLVLSVYTFLFFKNLRVKHNKWINWIASSVFGVYLISDNNFVRPFIWQKVFKNATLLNSHYLLFYMLFDTFIVFVISIIIDKFRIYVLEKHFMVIIDKILSRLTPFYNTKLVKFFPNQEK